MEATALSPSLQDTEMTLATVLMPHVSMMEATKVPDMLLDCVETPSTASTFELPPGAMPMSLLRSEEENSTASSKAKRKNLTDQQRVTIVHYLLANSAGGRLKHGDIKAAATHFGVHRATVRRLWKLHVASSDTHEGLAGNVASRIKGHSGRKPKVPDDELKARIAAVPVDRRMTGRGLSTALNVSNSVIVRLIKSGKLRRHPKKLHYVM
ncbi:hypothetical protein CCR75_001990 [Bremia lactucae]|uniref:DUF7769 domain-containing protein n=1 Tax=Bremia lactucae TaxID=4779 RepID=A0A976IMC3_BRELC|nr:hypothetical protein CCR75_001990 [Bremia lactucae]